MSDRSIGQPSTPGEKALLAMKKLTNSVSIFKVPKAPEKRKRQMKILPEDQYIEVSAHYLLALLAIYIYIYKLFASTKCLRMIAKYKSTSVHL